MLMTKEKRSAVRTLRGWAIAVLNEAHAIRECEEHGWAKDRADPHARERAMLVARQDPPPGVSPDTAAAEVHEVLDSIGDSLPRMRTGIAVVDFTDPPQADFRRLDPVVQ